MKQIPFNTDEVAKLDKSPISLIIDYLQIIIN